jgi:chromate transport protein ChrA
MGRLKEQFRFGLKKIAGSALNRIGCGIIGGIIVAYVLGKTDISQYLVIVIAGFLLFAFGAYLEYLIPERSCE